MIDKNVIFFCPKKIKIQFWKGMPDKNLIFFVHKRWKFYVLGKKKGQNGKMVDGLLLMSNKTEAK
jgi:hypothetical protein